MPPIHLLPAFLKDVISQEQYGRWLERKAATHLKRDKGRGFLEATRPAYKNAIHAAAIASHGFDYYTGERLDWALISTYCNEESKNGGHGYKEGFALLPTVDHVEASLRKASFVVCGWRTNSAKNDLSLASFLELCRKVIAHAEQLPK